MGCDTPPGIVEADAESNPEREVACFVDYGRH